MRIKIAALDKKARKFKKLVAAESLQLAKLLKRKGVIEVFLIDDRRMKNLNRQFRKKNRPTNVLSFQAPKNFPGAGLGEVYLDPIYISKHEEDWTLMLAHGVLHILGYDHEKRSDRIKMEQREAELLRKMKN